ncbi:MAG: MFS transporter [Candidatus Eisenbacteria bacterium]
MTEPAAPAHGSRWLALLWLALTSLLGMSTWFSGTAVLVPLRAAWHLSAEQSAWLTIAVQLGFVAGALLSALTNLLDVVPARLVLVVSALAAAAANAAFGHATQLPMALVWRALTGACLAGVYPPALKLMATWFRAERGRALGIMVGALTLGSAAPHLVRGLGEFAWREVVYATSWLALAGAAVALLLVREGPFPFPRARFDPSQAGRVLRDRGVRLACIGYFGHMWELYAMWGWIGVFLAGRFEAQGSGTRTAELWTFAVMAIGFASSWWAGGYSDRVGRTASAALAMVLSGACAIAIAFLHAAPLPLVLALALLWGASVIADSAQFSVMVTELADPAYVGTALTLQLSVGFALTVATLWLVPWLRELGGWQAAFLALAPGPVVGVIAMTRLRALPEAARLGGGRR